MMGDATGKPRPAITRFADRLEAELVKHAGEKQTLWTETSNEDLEESLKHHVDRLHWALQKRLQSKTPEELDKAREEIKRCSAHVGNYAMFIHDNAAMKRST
ncbi:MAG: hypothetical protein LN409_03920 [Candidatus Thermoplasmatota archaeon]|nr:hypothetical protein [Candidatus Thermoplasmatota archaeon]